MFWKRQDQAEKKLAQMNELLKKSFSNVKKDTTSIFQWLNYFYKKSEEQNRLIMQLQAELSYMPKSREEIRRIVDEHYSFERFNSKMKELDEKIDNLRREMISSASYRQQPVQAAYAAEPSLDEIKRRLERIEQRKVSIKERIVKRFTRNSKEYIKSLVVSYIKKYERISALQLKDMVVDEQNLCSKSSLYRILEEIEQMDEVGIIKEGKEKHYLYKLVKKA